MLTVKDFEILRRKVLLDGHSQRGVARELEVNQRDSVCKVRAPD